MEIEECTQTENNIDSIKSYRQKMPTFIRKNTSPNIKIIRVFTSQQLLNLKPVEFTHFVTKTVFPKETAGAIKSKKLIEVLTKKQLIKPINVFLKNFHLEIEKFTKKLSRK